MSTKPLSDSLQFFKIFDLAFLAPGVVIAIHLAALNADKLKGHDLSLVTVGGVLALLGVIGSVYALGLANFALSRVLLSCTRLLLGCIRWLLGCIRWLLGCIRWLLDWWFSPGWDQRLRARLPRFLSFETHSDSPGQASDGRRGTPLPLRFKDQTRDDMVLYFWYLRSTTMSLGVALIVSVGLLAFYAPSSHLELLQGVEFGIAIALFYLSYEYGSNLDSCWRAWPTREVRASKKSK